MILVVNKIIPRPIANEILDVFVLVRAFYQQRPTQSNSSGVIPWGIPFDLRAIVFSDYICSIDISLHHITYVCLHFDNAYIYEYIFRNNNPVIQSVTFIVRKMWN